MRKTIAIVTNSTWNIYNFRLGLIRRLKSEGYKVIVIAPVDEYIHYLNENHFTKHIPLRYLKPQSKNPLREILLFWELLRIYRRERPDLVLHYTIKPNIFGGLAAKMAGIPTISTITGLGYTFLNSGLTNRQVPRFYRLALKWSKKVVFFNQGDKELFEKEQITIPEQGVIIPGSGVNTNHFRPLPKPEFNKFIFLFVGRLLYDKGLREYVQAARQLRSRLRHAECWVIGDVNAQNPAAVSKDDVLNWVENQDIKYFGATDDVRGFLKQVDAVVLPSYREGMSRALLEALAMGKPVITTDVPGCRETVDEGRNGFLVPPHDPNSLTDAMEKLCRMDPGGLEAMGYRSRAKVLQEFDEKIITERYLRMIQTLLYERKPRRESGQKVL